MSFHDPKLPTPKSTIIWYLWVGFLLFFTLGIILTNQWWVLSACICMLVAIVLAFQD